MDTLNNLAYRPGTLNDYEVGLKTTLAPGTTFNLAAFYYDYKNYQAFVQVGFTQVVRNLPAKVKGIEADFTTRPAPGLTLQLSGTYLDSEVKDVLLPDGATIVTRDLPQAPKVSGSALARYEFALAGGTASVQADAIFQGKMCFTVMCAPVEREGGYGVANGRLGFTTANEKVDVALFVNNLFNRAYPVYAFDGSPYWPSPTHISTFLRTYRV